MAAVSFGDFDACKEALLEWNLEAVQLDRGPFRAKLEQVESAGILVTDATFSRRLHQTGEPPRGLRTVVVPADPAQQILWRNHRVSGDQIMLFPRGCALDSVSLPGFHVLTISFPEELASEIGCVLGGRDYEALLAGDEVLRLPPMRARALRRAAKRLIASSVGSGAAIGPSEKVDRDSGLDLLEVLIETLDRHDESSGQPLAREPDLALRRSLELIDTRPQESLSVADLCRASRVSRRTLEYAYQARFGLAPKAYMIARRLDGVRRDLKRSCGDRSVTRVANGWGFHHMSQFAALYKRQFGELPSQTLRAPDSSSRPRPVAQGTT